MPILQPIERDEYRPSLRMALCLATGGDHIFLSEKQDPAERYTPAQRETGWQRWGTGLLALHIQHHPGTRPAGWWQHEAPEPRRMVAYGPTKDPKLRAFLKTCPRRWGLPANTKDVGGTYASPFSSFMEAFYETQGAYLTRLQLLTPAEHASDFPYYERVQFMHAHEDDCPRLSLETIKQWQETHR